MMEVFKKGSKAVKRSVLVVRHKPFLEQKRKCCPDKQKARVADVLEVEDSDALFYERLAAAIELINRE